MTKTSDPKRWAYSMFQTNARGVSRATVRWTHVIGGDSSVVPSAAKVVTVAASNDSNAATFNGVRSQKIPAPPRRMPTSGGKMPATTPRRGERDVRRSTPS